MNLVQMAWACIIIGNVYYANDKNIQGSMWIVAAVVSTLIGLFIN